MHERLIDMLEELCEVTVDELERSNEKLRKAGGEMTAGDVDYLDKLTHMLKSIKTTLAMVEHDDGYGNSYARTGGRYRRDGSYNRGTSYARGRNAARDGMGRYSRGTGDMVEQLRDMMEDAPDERTRQEIQRLMTKMEQMTP